MCPTSVAAPPRLRLALRCCWKEEGEWGGMLTRGLVGGEPAGEVCMRCMGGGLGVYVRGADGLGS